jgi:hypothetical protein
MADLVMGARPGLAALTESLREAPNDSFGLFLGAGVNLPAGRAGDPPPSFKTYGWEALLREVFRRCPQRPTHTYEELASLHPDDWPGLAKDLVGAMGADAIVDLLDGIIYECLPRRDTYKRLSKKFLEHAPSLRAALCFASAIKAEKRKRWSFTRNPKIRAVITPNYDFFFGAGWTRYEAFTHTWRLETPFPDQPRLDDAEILRPGTISHIHGFIPYALGRRERLVLTMEDYRLMYRPGGYARRVLEEAVRKCQLVFVGTSFGDPPLRDALSSPSPGKRHFALVTQREIGRLQGLDVVPVIVGSHAEIPDTLREAYCGSLNVEQLPAGLPNVEAYWKCLLAGKDYAAESPAE